MQNRKRPSASARVTRKLGLSAFLILSFAGYALEHGAPGGPAEPTASSPVAVAATGTRSTTPVQAPTQEPAAMAETPATPLAGQATSSASVAPPSRPTAAPAPTTAPAPTAEPTATTEPTAPVVVAASGYKDGTYDGPQVDVQWGLVQVETTIRGGKITNVRFLEYPSDRRTSQRINSQATPWLQQEAIQAQSANVDLISGATLTSEGFQMSLQAALDQAKS